MKGNSFEEPYSVTEITRGIRTILEESFPAVWMEGEVSNYRQPASGHIYITLKDGNAQIQGVIYRGYARYLSTRLANGMRVLVFGSVSVYERGGSYQINIAQIEEKGVGSLHAAFEKLKDELQQKGYFDRKRPVPRFAKNIGVVTSPTGAAIQDFLNVTRRRSAGINVLIKPVRVQGLGASSEISGAIHELNKIKGLELIVITRGGGSIEDLWPFNEREVAEAIYHSPIPVVSAVGHEIDFTISDFVADLRASTPSAAAELIVADKLELIDKISFYKSYLKKYIKVESERRREVLLRLSRSRLFTAPQEMVHQHQQRLDDYSDIMYKALRYKLGMLKERLAGVLNHLNSLNPCSVLKRGFSITFAGGKIVRAFNQVKADQKITTKLYEGEIVSRVLKE